MSLIERTTRAITINLNINRVITFLIMADFFVIAGWGLVAPIFAVFVTEQIQGAGVEAVGLASTIYFLLKSGLQVPLANIIDKIKGEHDDFLALLMGSLVLTIVPLLYIFIKNVPQLFLVQALYGIGNALCYPAWLALFTRHIDKHKEGWEWSLYYTTIDLSGAAAAAIGGYLAKTVGFKYLFITVSILSFIGCLVFLKVKSGLKGPSVRSMIWK